MRPVVHLERAPRPGRSPVRPPAQVESTPRRSGGRGPVGQPKACPPHGVVIPNRKALVAVAQEFFERYNRRRAACFGSPVQTSENNLNVPEDTSFVDETEVKLVEVMRRYSSQTRVLIAVSVLMMFNLQAVG